MDLKAHLIHLEQQCIQPHIRTNPGLLAELFTDDFLENPWVGPRFDKAAALARIPHETPPQFSQWDFQFRPLSEDVAALIYRASIQRPGGGVKLSMRTSV